MSGFAEKALTVEIPYFLPVFIPDAPTPPKGGGEVVSLVKPSPFDTGDSFTPVASSLPPLGGSGTKCR